MNGTAGAADADAASAAGALQGLAVGVFAMLGLVTLASLRQPLAAAFGVGRLARVDATAHARTALLAVSTAVDWAAAEAPRRLRRTAQKRNMRERRKGERHTAGYRFVLLSLSCVSASAASPCGRVLKRRAGSLGKPPAARRCAAAEGPAPACAAKAG